jgi:hypothetical protein
MLSPKQITLYILAKVTQMVQSEGLFKESAEKSLRRYTTEVHPLLKERLTVHEVLDTDCDTITTTSSYKYIRTDQGFRGNSFMNYVLQSFFDHEEPEFGSRTIFLKASTKTIVNTPRDGGQVMDKAIHDMVLSLTNGNRFKPLALSAFAASLIGDSLVEDLLSNNLLDSHLGLHIQSFLRKHNLTFPHYEFLNMPMRKTTDDLVMVSKYYKNRDDNRAYCRDTNALRHFCGLCLHRLSLPESMIARQNLDRDKVIPAKDKDILNITLPIPRRNEVALLILGDVSNFTGSLANAWLMLFCMALELGQGGTWSKLPNLFSVRGTFISATWYEIIVLYLYLNVGYPAYIEELGVFDSLPGGFLGVAANITVGLVFLAVVLQNLINILSNVCRVIKAQAGGDDFAFGIIVDTRDREVIIETIREHITKYVGPLKEFQIIDLRTEPEGVLHDVTFCKKQVVLTKLANKLMVVGQDNIPISRALLPGGQVRLSEVEETWRSYDNVLRLWESKYGCEEQADALRTVFGYIYPSALPLTRTTTSLSFLDELEVRQVGFRWITTKAYELAEAVPDIPLGELIYLSEIVDKISYLLKNDKLTFRKVHRQGSELNLVLLKREVKKLTKTVNEEVVGLRPDMELVGRILKLIKI